MMVMNKLLGVILLFWVEHCCSTPAPTLSVLFPTPMTSADTGCDPGQYEPCTGCSCADCSAGQYQPDSDYTGSSCTTCPAGSYASDTGSTSCTSCPAGTSAAN
eukprot:CAMPEP_0114385024 /NCGR_PEP_ID=MMETSP0102-20121206/5726_1 /TAXON_ID=38822 ORGANISM="Pteridomonas danica, Strain PT" /NCGR_SAMPLE_ID=MMETSP0102 /ASSEMBLY_ACC=CAM_ASM_000212 /LENGTH=102 /DNA_ID=CAMNT_0001541473 /DNA_START=32 /DNA_END=337 /DNA_ORIENTATION=+